MALQASNEEDPYRCLLVDARMPDMAGLELARKMGVHPALRDTAIILLSFMNDLIPREVWRRAGVEGLLHKPIRMSRLKQTFERIFEGLPPEPAGGLITPPRFSKDHFRILVAEDNTANQTVLRLQFERLGYHVDAVGNGVEVLEAVAKRDYDMVIMDCDMPIMDGYTATEQIRREEVGKRRLPIIAMTAYAMPEDRERCFKAGMDDYLPKPVYLRDLIKLMDERDRPVDPAALARLRGPQNEAVPNIRRFENHILRTADRLKTIRAAVSSDSLRRLSTETQALVKTSERVGAGNMARISKSLQIAAEHHQTGVMAKLIDDLDSEFIRVKAALAEASVKV